MKKLVSILLLTSLILSLCGCNNIKSDSINNIQYPKKISYNDHNEKNKIIKDNPVSDYFIDALNEFSYVTTSAILCNETENINYSPVSLYFTLALASTGANGETKDELLTLLNMKDRDIEFLSTQCGNLFRTMYSDNTVGKLKLANSIWMQNGINFKDSFINNAANEFYASLFNIDFSNKDDIDKISKWISDNTNGLLSPKLATNPELLMSIINTVYFKDEWATEFDVNNTKKDIFYLEDDNEISYDFMNKTYGSISFIKGENFTRSDIGLKNSKKMIFILPNEGIKASELLSSSEQIKKLFDTSRNEYGKVIFQIPKFSFKSEIDLKDTLIDLGIKSLFTIKADFSQMTDNPIFTSNIEQQTCISIDEKGVEASAFTKMDMVPTSAPSNNEIKMILNRPFIYAITDNSGAILFIGICNNPLQK